MAAKRTPHIGRLTPESYFTNLDEKNRGSSQSNSVLSLVTHREKEREIAQMSLSLRTLPSFSSNLGRDEFSERDKKKLSFQSDSGRGRRQAAAAELHGLGAQSRRRNATTKSLSQMHPFFGAFRSPGLRMKEFPRSKSTFSLNSIFVSASQTFTRPSRFHIQKQLLFSLFNVCTSSFPQLDKTLERWTIVIIIICKSTL
jgi:hypothetical protein